MAATTTSKEKDEVEECPELHFEPVVKLAPVEVKTNEEHEEELFKMRAKLFRFDFQSDPPVWKERGVGDVKFMKHTGSNNVRLIMRRDKTHKICANHFITKDMKLKSSAGSDRAWVWSVQADFSDEEAKAEQLAIRFKNAENAEKFREEFTRVQGLLEAKEDPLAQSIQTLTLEEEEENKPEEEVEGEEGGERGGVKDEEGNKKEQNSLADAQPKDSDPKGKESSTAA